MNMDEKKIIWKNELEKMNMKQNGFGKWTRKKWNMKKTNLKERKIIISIKLLKKSYGNCFQRVPIWNDKKMRCKWILSCRTNGEEIYKSQTSVNKINNLFTLMVWLIISRNII